jgi:hypothetical protein
MREAIAIGLLWVGAFGLGASTQLLSASEAVPAPEAPAPAVLHPKRALDLLAYRLAGHEQETAAAPAAPPAVVVATRPAPPPPDIADILRRDVSVILLGAATPVLVVVASNGSSARRVLRVGEVYRDGWIVDAIDDQSVTLRRRTESRVVELYTAYPALVAENGAEAPTQSDATPQRRKSLPRKVARGDSR